MYATYKERIKSLSKQLVEAQQSLRILQALRIHDDTEQAVLRSNFRELPRVDAAYYHERNPLPFDPERLVAQFDDLKNQIEKNPGREDDLGAILWRNCQEYQDAVRMLQARGTPDFYEFSRKLYGGPADFFPGDQTTIHDSASQLYDILTPMKQEKLGFVDEKNLSAEQVVEDLSAAYRRYFESERVVAQLDDGIASDAAAGADYVKIKRGVMFSRREVDLLERHEGWVHVGTTLNGQAQHVAGFLAKGPPGVSDVQEGLAVTMELITFTTSPMRMKKLNNRVLACTKALQGADFLEVCEFYRTEGYSELECVRNAARVFRGGVMTGGAPFTKDIGYCKGFIKVYNFMRTVVNLGRPELLPFLFAGKLTLEDVPVLYEKYQEGIVDRPRYLPPHFRDLNGLAMWMAYSNFFNRVDIRGVREYYRSYL
jgi:uncharacterized protein (TIGR02421 family)